MPGTSRAILLTAPGTAAIAVVRLRGPLVGTFLVKHFSRAARVGRAVHGILRDGDGEIDDPVIVLAPGGAVADLNLHGGAWVVRSVLELARRAGFEVTEGHCLPLPDAAVDGEAELEREVLTHLPLARTELALRTLLAQPAAWAALARRVDGMPSERRRGVLRAVSEDRSLHHLLHPPRVAVVGAANVGKSTLANQLFGQERSITADLPGTTRDWVGEVADVDGLAVMLVDTPGVRDTADPVERAAIERGGEQVRAADLVVVVLDATRPTEPEQGPLLRAHPDALVVVNKVDRAPGSGTPGAPIPTVATTGEGVAALRQAVLARFGCAGLAPAAARAWTDRQRGWITRTVRAERPLDPP